MNSVKTDSQLPKVAFACVLLALSGFFLWKFYQGQKGPSELAFFYDLSEGKLFTASREGVPPIKGINDAAEDGVRAVVISTNGQPENRKTWIIAYLENYSPELRKSILDARARGASPDMGRAEAQTHRLVRRVTDKQWYPLASPEGERIVSDWAQPGPTGETPVVCTP